MGLIRPATPGFLVTLIATVLLAVVSFSVPYFQSIFFLKASLAVEGVSGSVTFGTLGYCLTLPNGTTCSKPSVGYEFDVNALVGDKIKFAQIPTIAVKWITYVLILHVVALGLAAISAMFGLLAHVREIAMTCCSSCISGFAAAAAMFAFIFDLVFFFLAKSRLNSVKGGSAEIGLGIWLTLAAWVLLFFSGCFYSIGRCCVGRRSRGGSSKAADKYLPSNNNYNNNGQDETMRLQAVKAEADRKMLAQRQEGGLPAFHEYDHAKPAEVQPLTARIDGDEVYVDEPYNDQQPAQQFQGGYAPAPAGNRTVDQYNDARRQPSAVSSQTTYPPQPQQSQFQPPNAPPVRQASAHVQATSGYAPSNYGAGLGAAALGATAGAGAIIPQYSGNQVTPQYSGNQYLAANPQAGGYQQPTGAIYGHGQDHTSYHSAQSHAQQPSSYSMYDPYAPQQAQPQTQSYYGAGQPAYNANTYSQSAVPQAGGVDYSQPPQHQQPTNYGVQQTNSYGAPPERSYTLGGNGYGANVVPPLHDSRPGTTSPGPGYMAYPGGYSQSLPPVHRMQSPTQFNPTAAYQGASSGRPAYATSPTQMTTELPPHYDGPTGGAYPAPRPGWDAKR